MPRLYFLRHGETDWNRDGRLQGQIDIPLNARGQRQAGQAGLHLDTLIRKEYGELPSLPLYLSPLGRARETAERVRDALGTPPSAFQEEPRLKEIAFGAWEGKTWAEIRARDPIGARDRDRDRWNYAPPGGESYAMVLDRVATWFESVREDAIVVAHGGIARVLLHHLGGQTRETVVGADIWQGKILRFANGTASWLPGPGHHA